jgi:hypothetical protein
VGKSRLESRLTSGHGQENNSKLEVIGNHSERDTLTTVGSVNNSIEVFLNNHVHLELSFVGWLASYFSGQTYISKDALVY